MITYKLRIGYAQATSVVYDLDDKPALAEFFAEVASHPASQMRCIVATKSCLPIPVLEKLAKDPHSDVVREIAQNKSALKAFSADLLIGMMSRDFGVAFELVKKLTFIEDNATRESVIMAMQKSGDPELLGKIAKYQRGLTVQAK